MIQCNIYLSCLVLIVCTLFSDRSVTICLAAVQATFYVAPNGSDTNPGTETSPFATIEKAKQAVRTVNRQMSGDVMVVLQGGTYRIDRTIVFGPEDSGANGHNVIYRAAPGETPIISGGKPVVGWKADANGHWKAQTDLDDFRQLYVDGARAIRARSGKLGENADPSCWEFLHDPSREGGLPKGSELIDNKGYRTPAVKMAGWRNPSDIEFCYTVLWTHTRCKVQSITREGDHAVVIMLQPYFTHARTKEGMQVAMPAYIENALELLDEAGEWYLDRPTKTVYYLPRAGEDMSQVEVIAPALEKLVELRGTLDKPIQHIRFKGITFRHGSWLRPSKIGHCEVQANFIADSDRKDSFVRTGGFVTVHNECLKSPASVVCHAAKSVHFERCTFTQLGGAGLDIEFGSQENVISGCHFYDISGTAVQIGDVLRDDHHPDDPRKIVKNNTVENCCIHDCCLEYMGGVGVFAGYTEGTRIAHNEIYRLPYTGVSIGWGWGEEDAGGGSPKYVQPFKYDTPTPAKNNRIEQNHIHHIMQPMGDGGGIYTLGNQPGTIIRGNYIHDNPGGAVYTDEGSGFIEIRENVSIGSQLLQNNKAQDRIATCNVHGNFFDIADEAKPIAPEVQAIIDKAGLKPKYHNLIEKP